MRRLTQGISRTDVALSAGLAAAIGISALPATNPWLVLDLSIPLLLLWRRAWPLIVASAVAAVVGIGQVLVPQETSGAGLGTVFALLLTMYSVAAHERSLLMAALGGLALVVGANLDLVRFGVEQDDFWPFRFMYLASAWAVGRIVLRRRLELEHETSRAVVLVQEHDARIQAALAAERVRLARELHDVIAHNVSVMVIQAGAGEAVIADRPETARQSLREIQVMGRQTVTELRRLLGILKDADGSEPERTVEARPSLSQLDQLIGQVRRAGLEVNVAVEGHPNGLPPSVDLSAYRIVQEGLTNVLRHARATRASVAVRHRSGLIEIDVVDDGVGVTGARQEGHGVIGMRERAALFGGTFEAGNRPDGGFGLRAVLPYERTA